MTEDDGRPARGTVKAIAQKFNWIVQSQVNPPLKNPALKGTNISCLATRAVPPQTAASSSGSNAAGKEADSHLHMLNANSHVRSQSANSLSNQAHPQQHQSDVKGAHDSGLSISSTRIGVPASEHAAGELKSEPPLSQQHTSSPINYINFAEQSLANLLKPIPMLSSSHATQSSSAIDDSTKSAKSANSTNPKAFTREPDSSLTKKAAAATVSHSGGTSNIFEKGTSAVKDGLSRVTRSSQPKSILKQSEVQASEFEYSGIKIVVAKGKIEDEQTDAIVNSTSRDFDMNGAISKAIGRRAGSDWMERCRKIGCLKDVHLTDAPNLDCQQVIHVRVPKDADDCFQLVLRVLEEVVSKEFSSISFPMIGTGGGDLNLFAAAKVLVQMLTLIPQNGQLRSIKEVHFVAYNDEQFQLFVTIIKDELQIASSQQQRQQIAAQSVGKESSASAFVSDLPAIWAPMGVYDRWIQIELEQNDLKFEKFRNRFKSEKANRSIAAAHPRIRKLSILKMSRLQNPKLYRNYMTTKEDLLKKYHDKPDVVKNLERTLFHGTAEDTVPKINSEGFDRRYCGKHATAYGMGVYFARDLSYSCDPIYSPPNSHGVQFVYVAKALVGAYTQGSHDMQHLPESFDSAVDTLEDPSMFVLFRDTQMYPKYILHIGGSK